MNNPIQFLQMLRNPQAFLSQMSSYNPVAKQTMQYLETKDNKALETMARNLCKERGIDINEMIKQLNSIQR